MLFCRQSGHRLEPVSEMRCAAFNRPVLHNCCDSIRNVQLQMASILNALMNRPVDVLRQTFLHYLISEDETSVDFRN